MCRVLPGSGVLGPGEVDDVGNLAVCPMHTPHAGPLAVLALSEAREALPDIKAKIIAIGHQ